MKRTKTHDEYGAVAEGATLSGNTYVSLRSREGTACGRVLLMTPQKCNHGITICERCADSWEIDHVVHYARTAAGRALRERLDHNGRDTAPAAPPAPDVTPPPG
ncbi:hypothetical protein [Nocardia bovistercoris]|uniref:Uncharacterized protein n=1 Tax=Nocardia bovistercoris TaxID=2785916 RepID=A0A931IBX8_9NOCA|nr:hypothetical protein [Nocardia bovistercoris]MBH0777688.1 hypothetical protein [Nocardia bovistercoris]